MGQRAAKVECVKVDGSLLEGGGQVLRVTSSLAAGLGRDLAITRIRAGRSTPGLRPQHVASLRLAAEIGQGTVEGCDVGSAEARLSFSERPRQRRRREGLCSEKVFEADAGTAGATSLMVQAALPALVAAGFEDAELRLRGGTNVAFAPSADHVETVLAPNLELLCGVDLQVDVERRGWFPAGGGRLKVRFQRGKGDGDLDWSAPRADPVSIDGVVNAKNQPRAAAEALAATVAKKARDAFFPHSSGSDNNNKRNAVRVVVGDEDLASSSSPPPRRKGKRQKLRPAFSVQLALRTSSRATIGADVLVDKAIDGCDAIAGDLVATLVDRATRAGAGVDEQTADQLIAFMALKEGSSKIRCPAPSCRHLETSIHFTTLMTGVPFTVTKDEDGASVVVECRGRGSSS